jgi:hypothetical protein
MARVFDKIKVVELNSRMQPNKAGVRLLSIYPLDVAGVLPGEVVDLLKVLNVVEPDAFVQLFYQDGNDFITPEVDTAGWPESCCDDKSFKVWYRLSPCDEYLCSGTHVHNPSGPRYDKLTTKQYQGYVLLKAVEDGCLACVKTLVGRGVSVNFRSVNMKYTPYGWALWQKKKKVFTEQQFEKMQELLISLGANPSV